MRKFNYLICIASLLLSALFTSCQEDDIVQVDSAPEFFDTGEKISSLPGLMVNLQSRIEDQAGIKSIRLLYEPWFLDKTIVKDSLPETYELNYAFQIPEDEEEGTSHALELIAENSGGIITRQIIEISLDADFENPVLTIQSPDDNATVQIGEGNEIMFELNLTDNKSLAKLKIESDVLNETIDLTGSSFTYNKSLNIEDAAIYEFVFTLSDAAGNTTTTSTTINVVEDLNFIDMYLADDSERISFNTALTGYPYPAQGSTSANEQGYVFSIDYLAEEDNTGVYFVAQKSGFGPFSFGANPEEEGELIIGADSNLTPIILEEKGYYNISMDLRDLSYKVTPIAATSPENVNSGFTGVYITGSGLKVNGVDITRFNPANSSASLNINPDFQYRYSGDLEFNEESGQFIFIGNQVNYSIFWRLNSGAIESANALVPQGGNNCAFTTQYEGEYTVVVDIFLNTFTIAKKSE
ncbi:hypothetical protein [Leeuwenhoekiella sp. ZYFB001]|uniref:hypothetical protein n=1 Tax=Leeuwenhoekiella sp. ZYFB001 TaxID=2719912 RepID=UPI001430E65F|nr:hypothetical protein [Leeuwenhoekiella sp. ZYFB001]